MATRPLRTRRPDATRVQVSLSLPADVFDQLRERAEDTERSLSNMATVLLRQALEIPE